MVRAISPISKVPLLRIVLPLIVGVVFSVYIPSQWLLTLLAIPLIVSLISLYVYRKDSIVTYLSLLSTVLFSMFIGVFLIWERSCGKIEFDDDITYFRATLVDAPRTKQRSISLELRVDAVADSSMRFANVDYRSILYIPKSHSADSLRIGDRIIYSSRFDNPSRNPLPGAFDYPTYLTRKGILQSSYADSTMWGVIGVNNSITLLPAKCRHSLLVAIRGVLPDVRHYSVVEAILLGYKSDLSDGQKHNFRVGGLSHLLAVSGFHVAILFSILTSLFIFIGRDSKFYVIRIIIPLLLLWCYALVVGATPSVLRASLMLTLYAISKLLRRNTTPYNTLLFAALVLIVIDPYSIFDIGAQLSFVAVLGIILFTQTIGERINKMGQALRLILTLPMVTISAQIATAPLTIYYFNLFPTLFLLSNILILPLIYIVITLVVPILVLYMLFDVKIAIMVSILEWSLNSMDSIIGWIASKPIASFEGLYIPLYWSVMIYIVFIILALPISYIKKALSVLATVVVLLAFIIYNDWVESARVGVELLYCDNRRVVIEYKGLSTFVYADSISDRDIESLNKWSGRGRGDIFVDNSLEPLWSSQGRSLLYLNSDTLRFKMTTESHFYVDYLLLDIGCKGDLKHYVELFSPNNIILSPKLYGYWRDKWVAEADSLAIPLVFIDSDTPCKLY
ncbi:MAG: ComEC/Rec2 family competence protein [Bacteroidales bacterium]